MENEELPKLQISELIIVKCGEDWTRTFMGEIFREKTKDGKDLLRGKLVINDVRIWCIEETEETLNESLDIMCTLILDHRIHSKKIVTTKILGEMFFLN